MSKKKTPDQISDDLAAERAEQFADDEQDNEQHLIVPPVDENGIVGGQGVPVGKDPTFREVRRTNLGVDPKFDPDIRNLNVNVNPGMNVGLNVGPSVGVNTNLPVAPDDQHPFERNPVLVDGPDPQAVLIDQENVMPGARPSPVTGASVFGTGTTARNIDAKSHYVSGGAQGTTAYGAYDTVVTVPEDVAALMYGQPEGSSCEFVDGKWNFYRHSGRTSHGQGYTLARAILSCNSRRELIDGKFVEVSEGGDILPPETVSVRARPVQPSFITVGGPVTTLPSGPNVGPNTNPERFDRFDDPDVDPRAGLPTDPNADHDRFDDLRKGPWKPKSPFG